MGRYATISLVILMSAVASRPAAAAEPGQISVAIGYSAYGPAFGDLFNGAYRAPASGEGTLVDSGTGATSQVEIYSGNRLDATEFLGSLNLELSYRLSRQLTLQIGFNQWEQTSINTEIESWPIAGIVPQYSDMQRLATIELKDIYAGFRHTLLARSASINPYWGASLHQVSDVSYRERFQFSFSDPQFDTLQRYSEQRFSGADSQYLLFSLGNEFILNPMISFRLEGAYAYSRGSQKLIPQSASSNISSDDKLTVTPPTSGGSDGYAHYLIDPQSASPSYGEIDLGLSGWQLALSLNFSF